MNAEFDEAKYTVYKVVESLGRKPVMFNLSRRDVENLLTRVLGPQLVRVTSVIGEWDSEWAKFEAEDNSNPSNIIRREYTGDAKSETTKELDWVG